MGVVVAVQKAIFGIYQSRGAANNGVTALKNNGFRIRDISVHVDGKDWAEKAQSVLQVTGAKDVAATSELRSEVAGLGPHLGAATF